MFQPKMTMARIAVAMLLIGGALLLGAALLGAAPSLTAQEIPWQKDYAKARRMAAEQRKPLLIHFWSESCGPCRKLDQYVFPNSAVVRAVDGVVPVKINTREQRRLASQFGIKRIPTDVMVSAEGRELWRGISPGTVNEYISMVKRAVARQQIPDTSGLAQLADAARNQGTQFIGQAGYSPRSSATSEPATDPTNRRSTSQPLHGGGQFQTQNNTAQANHGGQFQAQHQQPNANSYHVSDKTSDPNRPGEIRTARSQAGPSNRPATGGAREHRPEPQPDANPFFNSRATTGPSSSSNIDAAAGQGAGQVRQAASQPKFALEGYCPVSLMDNHRWSRGSTLR